MRKSTLLAAACAALFLAAPLASVQADDHGLLGTYYKNMSLSGDSVKRTDGNIYFDWGDGSPIDGVGQDNFSVRWTGQIEAQYSETYTFTLTSDDGARLWVNGKPVVNDWSDHASQDKSGTINLEAGKKYDLVLEYYENAGEAVMKMMWSSKSVSQEAVPKERLYTKEIQGHGGPENKVNGLIGHYFPNMDFTGDAKKQVDSEIDFNWGQGAPMDGIGADHFSIRWTGQIQPKNSETYTFTTTSDDGVRLWINGKQIIDNWTDHPSADDTGTIALEAGKRYDIVLEYYENEADAVCKLQWESSSTPKAIIPADNLFQKEVKSHGGE